MKYLYNRVFVNHRAMNDDIMAKTRDFYTSFYTRATLFNRASLYPYFPARVKYV